MWYRNRVKVELPYPVLLVSAREEAARRLGVSVADVVNVAYGYHAYRDGKLFGADAFREAFPNDEFEAFTAGEALPADLMVKELNVRRDPAQRLAPPITAADVAAVDAAAQAAYVARLTELTAPGIILRHARSMLQQACEAGERHAHWEPLAELVTGDAPAGGRPPRPMPPLHYPFPTRVSRRHRATARSSARASWCSTVTRRSSSDPKAKSVTFFQPVRCARWAASAPAFALASAS